MLSANPKFVCTGERIIQKTPLIWAGGNSTRLFTNPLTASPLAFTTSLPKQKHSRTKSRQLRRLRKHALRANCQAAIWERSLKRCPEIPSPLGCGWCTNDGKLAIDWMGILPASKAVLELLSCQCRRLASIMFLYGNWPLGLHQQVR